MTATDPATGIVHELAGNVTLCGKDATSWSRAVTEAQQKGLVLFCDPCKEGTVTP